MDSEEVLSEAPTAASRGERRGGFQRSMPVDFEEEAKREQELQRRVREYAVPVEDAEVRHQLRFLEQPVAFFGERPAERRDRLRARVQAHVQSERALPQFPRYAAAPRQQQQGAVPLPP